MSTMSKVSPLGSFPLHEKILNTFPVSSKQTIGKESMNARTQKKLLSNVRILKKQ